MRLFPPVIAVGALLLGGCTPFTSSAQSQQPEGGQQSVSGAAGAIYVDDGGGKDGLPVLFLHSFAGDSSHWASQLDHLRHHRRALAIDLRGHGKSAAPRDDDYSIGAMVKDLEAVVDKLQIQRFVLVGHSLGGAVAIHYAARHPSRVAGLVVVGAPGKVPAEQSKQILGAIEADYDQTMKGYWEKLVTGAQPHVRTQVLGKMESVAKDDSMRIMRALFADDPLVPLDRYNGPKLIIYTSQGNTPNDLQNARPKIPNRVMDGTSHWPHLDKPAEFNALLDEFLAGVK
jgi:pimeloyl-ACP methyl ester carboxylesterase